MRSNQLSYPAKFEGANIITFPGFKNIGKKTSIDQQKNLFLHIDTLMNFHGEKTN
jgi:hypothetical protein